jgi:hypothetical protein
MTMETTTTAQLIKRYLQTFETTGTRLQDILDDEIFEVLAGVAWVREALAESAPNLAAEDARDVLFGLKTLAA